MYCQFPQGRVCPSTVDIVPDDGDILLFPSWLIHTTRKNKISDQRISVAFNIDYVGGDHTVFGLSKESHTPYHKTEYSLKSIMNKG
jgi:ectoine hydroxylase-related dioxygenase (phytanoyl-CoA dioxygenase family)